MILSTGICTWPWVAPPGRDETMEREVPIMTTTLQVLILPGSHRERAKLLPMGKHRVEHRERSLGMERGLEGAEIIVPTLHRTAAGATTRASDGTSEGGLSAEMLYLGELLYVLRPAVYAWAVHYVGTHMQSATGTAGMKTGAGADAAYDSDEDDWAAPAAQTTPTHPEPCWAGCRWRQRW